ncbi:MAG: hypothetical protein AAF542_25585 [Pseudomonadota bacterium]
MNKENAEQLSLHIVAVHAMVNDIVRFTKENKGEKVFDNLTLHAGKIMAALYLDIGDDLWKMYPEFKPEGIGGNYEITDEFYEKYLLPGAFSND